MPGVGACGAASRELPVAVDSCLAIGLGFSLDRNPRFFGGLSTQAWFPCSDGWAVFSAAAASPLSSDRGASFAPPPPSEAAARGLTTSGRRCTGLHCFGRRAGCLSPPARTCSAPASEVA